MTVIREASRGDAPAIAALLDQLGHPLDPSMIAANIDTLTAMGLAPLVATQDDSVFAVCALSIMHTLHRRAPVGRVSMMVVDEVRRSGGVGAALVAEAERRLEAAGCYMIEVTSNLSRERAHHFYEQLGYERTSVRFAKTF
jgi:N-acetylglutamate synthase-like GNAT family acetyltransferase